MRLLVCTLALASGVAAAQSTKPMLAVVPLDLDPEPKLMQQQLPLRDAFFSELDKQSGAFVVPKREAEAALIKTQRQDFRESDESLARFAEKAGVLYALQGWVQRTPKKQLVLTARVVRDDGKVMKSAEVSRPEGKHFVETLKLLVGDLTKQLDIGSYPLTKEVAVKPPPVETPPVEVKKDPPPDFVPPPPPPLVEVKDTGAGQRAAGQGLFVTGLAVAAVGGIVAGVGCAVGCAVKPQQEAVSASQLSALQTGRGLTTAGFVGIGVGAAATIVGAIVWGTAPATPSKTTVSLSPTAGGAMLQVGGAF